MPRRHRDHGRMAGPIRRVRRRPRTAVDRAFARVASPRPASAPGQQPGWTLRGRSPRGSAGAVPWWRSPRAVPVGRRRCEPGAVVAGWDDVDPGRHTVGVGGQPVDAEGGQVRRGAARCDNDVAGLPGDRGNVEPCRPVDGRRHVEAGVGQSRIAEPGVGREPPAMLDDRRWDAGVGVPRMTASRWSRSPWRATARRTRVSAGNWSSSWSRT